MALGGRERSGGQRGARACNGEPGGMQELTTVQEIASLLSRLAPICAGATNWW
jgi:hypothetical protein